MHEMVSAETVANVESEIAALWAREREIGALLAGRTAEPLRPDPEAEEARRASELRSWLSMVIQAARETRLAYSNIVTELEPLRLWAPYVRAIETAADSECGRAHRAQAMERVAELRRLVITIARLREAGDDVQIDRHVRNARAAVIGA